MTSWFSTAITVTSYYRTIRRSDKTVHNVGYAASFIYLLGRLFELGPRFLVIVLALTYLPPWYAWLIVGCVHYMASIVMVVTAKPDLQGVCAGSPTKKGFMALFSFVFIFCYVHLEAGKTFKRALVYYIIFYVENFVIAGLVFFLGTNGMISNTWQYLALTVPPCFVVHMLLLFLYYKCLHPDIESVCKKFKCTEY